MFPTLNIKEILTTVITIVVIGTYVYVQSLKSDVAERDQIIHKQEVIIKTDKISDVAHDLTAELNTTMEKAKGERHEVEINTTIGHHSIHF